MTFGTVIAVPFIPYVTPSAPPVPAAPAPTAPAPEPTNVSLANPDGTPMPLSGGQRRINGRPIDRIAGALNADGSGSGTIATSAGLPLFPDRDNDLFKITAGAVTIYEDGIITHPAVDSVTWYPGTETQTADPDLVAEHGADSTPAYRGEMYAVVKFNSYKPWNNQEPALTIWITNGVGGAVFRAWGGTWNSADKASNIVLSGGDLVVDHSGAGIPQASVRGTQARSTGKWTYGITWASRGGIFGTGLGTGLAIANASSDLTKYMGSQDTSSFRWGCDGDIYLNGFFAGTWVSVANGESQALFIDTTGRRLWGTKDGVTFYGFGGVTYTAADVVAGTGGLDISAITGALYPAVTLSANADQGTADFSDPAFLVGVGVSVGDCTRAEVIVAAGEFSALDPANILVSSNITESVPGVIFIGNWNWLDFLRTDGQIANHDYFEDGEDVRIVRVPYESPTVAFSSIPVNHRLAPSDKGSTQAVNDGERKKPKAVFHSYYDVSRQFQPSMVVARSEANITNEELRLSTPWVLEAADASLGAAIALGKAELEAEEYEQYLPPLDPYPTMQPTDVVNFTLLSKTYQAKVRAVTLESDWGLKTEYHSLLELADDLTVPGYAGEIPPEYMPRSPVTGLDFSKTSNSALMALFEDI